MRFGKDSFSTKPGQEEQGRVRKHRSIQRYKASGQILYYVIGCGGERKLKRHKRRNGLLSKSRSAIPAGRSGVFFEKSGGFLSDVFHRQAMPVIGIENKTVGYLGGLEGVAQEIRLVDGNQRS